VKVAIETANKSASDAGRDAGNAHAVEHGRQPSPSSWDDSDRDVANKVANQIFLDAYYELLPRYSPWHGKFRTAIVSDKSSGAELLRALKKIHLYHGSYIPSPESKEDMTARLGIRHLPLPHARGCGCGMHGYKTRKRDGRKFRA